MKFSKNWISYTIIFILVVTIVVREYFYLGRTDNSETLKKIEYASAIVTKEVIKNNQFPEKVQVEDEYLIPIYSFEEKYQDFLDDLLYRYPSDYTAIVILDNNTGAILATSGIEKNGKKRNYSLSFTSTHPAASLFKIVASADLLENTDLERSTVMNYRGRGTTLYKYQLTNKTNKWTRFLPFERAFAHSNNVVFGKAAITRTNGFSLYKTATKFGFNQNIMPYFNLASSYFVMPENQYHLAELASGLNRDTMMSPIHAAALSSIIANDGYFVQPYMIEGYKIEGGKEVLKKPIKRDDRIMVLSKETTHEIRAMMNLAIEKGTARRVSRRLKKQIKDQYDLGAKTGSITGGHPFGKRDWLTFYVKPAGPTKDRGISVAIMNINKKKWYYKSTFLAEKVISFYYSQNKDSE